MQKIIPHLWFDTQAKEAAAFYVSLFEDSSITNVVTLHDTPSGESDMVSFTLAGQAFMAISAGPYFTLNPSVSLMLNFDPARDPDARAHLDEVWQKLSEGGKVLMPLDIYPFSEHYGWIQDKYGLTWQLILTNPAGEARPFIIASMMFANEVYGKAEAATDFYMSVFSNTKRGTIARYPGGMEPNKEGAVMFTDYMLEGQWFAAIDAAGSHGFGFNEAFSFIVKCDTQEEIDYYWNALSAVPEAEQCGWLKDIYGVSWQITPTIMDTMIASGDTQRVARVTEAFLKMKKFDIAILQAAYNA